MLGARTAWDVADGHAPRPARGRVRSADGEHRVHRLRRRRRARRRDDPRTLRAATARTLVRRRRGAEPLDPADLLDCQRLLSGIPNAITPINDGLARPAVPVAVVQPDEPDGRRSSAARRTTARGRYTGSPAVVRERRRRRRPVRLRRRRPDHPLPQLLRRDAGGQLPRQRPDGRGWRSTTRCSCPARRGRSTRRSIADPRRRRARVHRPRARLADRRQRRRPRRTLEAPAATRCSSIPHRTPCGDWAADRAEPDRPTASATARGHYVVATERAPSDDGTLWAATRTGRVFVTHERRRRAPLDVTFHRIDTRDDAGPLRQRDRDRPERPEPRVGLLLGLQRVHAGHARATCSRSTTTRRRGTRDVDRPLVRPRRPAGHRHRVLRRDRRRLRGDRLRRAAAAPRREPLAGRRLGPAAASRSTG